MHLSKSVNRSFAGISSGTPSSLFTNLSLKMKLPKLEKIIIGSAREKLYYVDTVIAVPGRGLMGDRYFDGKGTFNHPALSQTGRELSMIDINALYECNERIGSDLDFTDLRRNLVVSNLDFDAIKRKPFWIGNVKLKINRTAPPCQYLSKLLSVDIMKGLKYNGGYRVDILTCGEISIGDEIRYKE
ncbi:MAG TPA: MOSC domain-containing protein [Sulfuricurvum sp.]|nr:MOSC domain-containing protein [Sulfuricurvum sp.]